MVDEVILAGHKLQYFDDTHTYIVDDIVVPSITQILKHKFKDKYKNVDERVLERASVLGTAVHKAIEDYEVHGIESDLEEFKNYKFLKKYYNFSVQKSEIYVIIILDTGETCAGRLDQIIQIGEDLFVNDIKRTATLDLEYLSYQETLYKIGVEQCYNMKITGLKGTHLRKEKRKFVDVKYIEEEAIQLVRDYFASLPKIENFLE